MSGDPAMPDKSYALIARALAAELRRVEAFIYIRRR